MRMHSIDRGVRCVFQLGVVAAALCTAGVAQAQLDAPPQRLLIGLEPSLFRAQGSDHGRIADARIAQLSQRVGVSLKRLRTVATGAEVVELAQPLTADALEALKAQIAKNDLGIGVGFVDEDRLLQSTATPTDAQYSQQWDLYEATAGVNAPTAWNSSTGAGVVVGVIDTGYRPHADLVPMC